MAPISEARDVFVARVQACATVVRAVLERAERGAFGEGLRDFPRGACLDAALLLGAALTDAGLGTFTCRSGERGAVGDGTHRTHAWLEGEGLVVDITADQFGPECPPIHVAGEPLPVHRTFDVLHSWPGDFRARPAGWGDAGLYRAYAAVRAALDRPHPDEQTS